VDEVIVDDAANDLSEPSIPRPPPRTFQPIKDTIDDKKARMAARKARAAQDWGLNDRKDSPVHHSSHQIEAELLAQPRFDPEHRKRFPRRIIPLTAAPSHLPKLLKHYKSTLPRVQHHSVNPDAEGVIPSATEGKDSNANDERRVKFDDLPATVHSDGGDGEFKPYSDFLS
jgi:hypothetical protein